MNVWKVTVKRAGGVVWEWVTVQGHKGNQR